MNIRTIFITRYVDDHDTAIDWYSQLFGRRPDEAPVPDCREWNLQTGVVFQVIRQPERAGEQSFAFGITDFQQTAGSLESAGLPSTDEWQVAGFDDLTFLELRDPEGVQTGLLNT